MKLDYIYLSKQASKYEMNNMFEEAAFYWALCVTAAKNEINRKWAAAREELCNRMLLIQNGRSKHENELPGCYSRKPLGNYFPKSTDTRFFHSILLESNTHKIP